MAEVCLMAQFVAKPGKTEELKKEFLAVDPLTHAEKGCLRYILYQAKEDPRVFTFFEKFASQEAFDYHANTPYISRFLNQVVPEIVESQSILFQDELFS